MFLTRDGRLLVNEIAPRVHNSGHYTLGACVTSQFEQHARAVCGLPLGSTEAIGPATMVNLMGELWAGGEPRWETLDAVPHCVLHLYGKSSARPGRKMGHYTVVGPGAPEEFDRADERLRALAR
jgi:5-(carboxyamino)imidazole ribonucleotide synthase